MTSRTGKARVILGTMTFGPDPSTGARVTSLDTYNSVLDCFQSQGYSEIDTARCYVGGQQEAFTRAANWKARGLTCATKWYPYGANDEDKVGAHKAERLEQMFNKSLEELGTDYVDIFYLHAADRTVPFQEPLRKMDELHKKGRFGKLGISNFTSYELAEVVMICKANSWVQPTVFQCVYNAITRSIDPELVAACRRYGLDIVVYNPIAGGLLSGKYTSLQVDAIPSEGRYSNVDGEVGDVYRKRYFKNELFEALRIIESAAQRSGLTLLEIAFRWLIHHSALNIKDGGNDGIVIGVSSQAQLEQNLQHLEKGPLPDDVLEALDVAAKVSKATAQNYWHGELEYTYNPEEALRTIV
ncbi:hypothetical protein ASPACDRAFT_35318 [Aspergillus aculeatus ATCC 16872]|uniref:NADP-dependent oxidoreductase domain-containing protein n=1 Tax=Aspergillus aculeatus (strain ATCC 16872 / CBS 172.66 / WB 5094) TaxID=690307 RepID=A0A1L9WIW8_ASPA1|nr:uncharacterized protein ASPACDRAFT_35318 [Aspergillus aculeatus ATCC 16872]OJJ96090.1 hypothetical protein ASPACDRAFT_35318 [Aspergillus aculeatus ATCC 16872]